MLNIFLHIIVMIKYLILFLDFHVYFNSFNKKVHSFYKYIQLQNQSKDEINIIILIIGINDNIQHTI